MGQAWQREDEELDLDMIRLNSVIRHLNGDIETSQICKSGVHVEVLIGEINLSVFCVQILLKT